MTADRTAALLDSPAFLALCAAWERDGRASEAGADWLRERGFEGEADGWEWAVRESANYLIGPRPHHHIINKRFYWHTNPRPKGTEANGCIVPTVLFADGCHNMPRQGAKTFAEAVVVLLTRWAAVRPQSPAMR